jgi:AraC-like DNA-binding protein
LNEEILALSWNGDSRGRAEWVDQMAAYAGMTGRVDLSRSQSAHSLRWSMGAVGVAEARLSGVCLSPLRSGMLAKDDEYLFVKIVTHGTISITQHGETVSMPAGTVVLVDPAWSFEEHFTDPAALTVMWMPRVALRARGYSHALHRPLVPDIHRPDVAVVRDFLLFAAGRRLAPGEALRRQLGEQCLDLVDVFLQDPQGRTLARGPEATLLRAKRIIARNIGDPTLSISRVAAELNVSSNYLGRLFKRDGTSVMRYVGALRLERAARLLQGVCDRPMQIQEIAYQCGYVSLAHFSRAYKQRFGMSPRAAIGVSLQRSAIPA